jgi:lysophospholipase L1-like esterase
VDHKLSSSIREMANGRSVLLANEHAFDALEHPELFKDGMHMNREGINRFSAMLAAEVTRVLGAVN